MTQELTLFDLGVEEPEEMKVKKAKPAASTSVATKKEVKKPEPVFVTGDWTIHFATDTFTVADFVDEIPEEGVTLDQVREGLERLFPQFSAARTKWDVNTEKKQLFPDAFAGSKGAIVQDGFSPSFFLSTDDVKNANVRKPYILSGDGKIMEYVSSPIGTMIAETNEIELPIIKNSFEFNIPKIPNQILRQIIGFFKAYIFENAKYEVVLRVYWDQELATYVVECPEQVVTPVTIQHRYSDQYTGRNSLRYLPVLEVHSHNVMRAFFSSTDDEDEQAYGIYGVFGRLDKTDIDMIFRVKKGSTALIIPASKIFELEFTSQDLSFPDEWKSKVTMKGGW